MLCPLPYAVGGERRTLGAFPLPPLHQPVKRFYRALPTGCYTPRPRLGGYLRFFLRPFLRFATAVALITRLAPFFFDARAVFRVVTLITSLRVRRSSTLIDNNESSIRVDSHIWWGGQDSNLRMPEGQPVYSRSFSPLKYLPLKEARRPATTTCLATWAVSRLPVIHRPANLPTEGQRRAETRVARMHWSLPLPLP